MLRLVLLAIVLAPASARAGACSVSISVSAASPELARDGLVVLDAGSHGAELTAATLQFATGTETIPARVIRIIGDPHADHVQIVLAPTSALPARATVHLTAGTPELDALLASHTLTTSDRVDGRAVRWQKPPVVLGHRSVPSNKGDTLDAYRVRVQLDAPAFVIGTFTAKHDTQVALYRIERGEILAGLVGCGSMWSYRSGTSILTLTALGPDGHEVAAPGKAPRLTFR